MANGKGTNVNKAIAKGSSRPPANAPHHHFAVAHKQPRIYIHYDDDDDDDDGGGGTFYQGAMNESTLQLNIDGTVCWHSQPPMSLNAKRAHTHNHVRSIGVACIYGQFWLYLILFSISSSMTKP